MKEINNFAYFRKKKGLTQIELADLVDVAQSSLARYERGEMQPSVEVAQKLANVLNVTVDELLNGSVSNEWELKIKLSEEGEIDVASCNPVFDVNVKKNGIAVTLGGTVEMWSDVDKFEKAIEDLRQKRESVLKFYEEAF